MALLCWPITLHMELKYAKLSGNPTIKEIDEEIARLEQASILHTNMDEGLKRLINSTFGVLGYIKFPCYHLETALAVTQQAADLLRYAQTKLNFFFSNIWMSEDVTNKWYAKIKAFREKWDITKWSAPTKSSVVYMDTDSTFISIAPLMKSCGYKGDEIEFILSLRAELLDDYIKDFLVEYCGIYGAFPTKELIDNSPSFALAFEQICESVIWVAKKRYIKHLRYYKKQRFERMKKVDIRGLETRSSATPTYVRTELKKLFLYITDKGASLNRVKLTEELRMIKKQFDILPTDSICKMARLGTYDKTKINDTTAIEYIEGAESQIKGAILYNYLLNRSPEYKTRYSPIQQGMRVKWYYIKRPYNGGSKAEVETFAYLPDGFPAEFAPEMAINVQFEKLILSPVNNVVEALHMKPIIKTLLTAPDLF